MSELLVPDELRFDRAIELAQLFLTKLKQKAIAPAEITPFIAKLVATENGARGFFVTYLTADDPICDEPQAEIIAGLQASSDISADLLVKNVAMSTAQKIHHERNHDADMAASSARVTQRTLLIIERLNSPQVRTLALELQQTLASNAGSYSSFLDRWRYDTEQRQAIATAIELVVQDAHAN